MTYPSSFANGDAHSGSFNGAALGLLGFSDATGRGPSSLLFAPKVDELTDQREHDPSSVSARFDQRDTRGLSGRPPSESGGP
jgi:hypothetical protein